WVCLGPQADFPGCRERVVPTLQNAAMVQVHLKTVATDRYLQDAPAVGRNVALDSRRQRKLAAVFHLVQRHIFVQRVGRSQVIVVGVPVAPNHTASLVLAPRRDWSWPPSTRAGSGQAAPCQS